MKQVIDRRVLHKTEVFSGIVRRVHQLNGYIYVQVFVPALGVTLPFVRADLPFNTPLFEAQQHYPEGKQVTVFKRAGQWFV